MGFGVLLLDIVCDRGSSWFVGAQLSAEVGSIEIGLGKSAQSCASRPRDDGVKLVHITRSQEQQNQVPVDYDQSLAIPRVTKGWCLVPSSEWIMGTPNLQ